MPGTYCTLAGTSLPRCGCQTGPLSRAWPGRVWLRALAGGVGGGAVRARVPFRPMSGSAFRIELAQPSPAEPPTWSRAKVVVTLRRGGPGNCRADRDPGPQCFCGPRPRLEPAVVFRAVAVGVVVAVAVRVAVDVGTAVVVTVAVAVLALPASPPPRPRVDIRLGQQGQQGQQLTPIMWNWARPTAGCTGPQLRLG